MSDKPNKESAGKTLLVAFLLCVVCSIVVSTAAVGLKAKQDRNKLLDLQRNVLAAAAMLEEGATDNQVEEAFSKLEGKLVDLETGQYATEAALAEAGIDVDSYDQKKASKDPALSSVLDGKDDIASIKRKVRFAKIYLLKDNEGQIEKIILPVHGYGLWSTLYGFIALQGDANTVEGLGFYAHAETPGLGGEVDNPNWKALWPGKQVYSNDGSVSIKVVKGSAQSANEIDGLSGATLTTRGVDNLVAFWMGEQGFGPFLNTIRSQTSQAEPGLAEEVEPTNEEAAPAAEMQQEAQ